MEGTSPRRALSELLRRGTKDTKGADRLAAEVNRRRRELLNRNNLDGTLQEIKQLLDEAVLSERKELARALDDDARFAELQIEALSPSPAKAVQELSDYDWRSPEARQKYEQIKDLLGREMLDQRFSGMKQALENATDEDRQAVNEMLDDLNDLLDKHSRGEDSPEDFQNFMRKHGQYFPENPKNVEELLDSLAKRAAAAQRFRNSLSRRPARRTGCLGAAGIRLAGADECAQPAGLPSAGGPARRGLERLVGVLRRQPAGHGGGRAGARRYRRTRAARRPAVAELRRGHHGGRRSRRAGPPARRSGRHRCADAGRAGESPDESGLSGSRLRRAVAVVAEGDAATRSNRSSRCRPTTFGTPRRAGHPSCRRGRRADRRDPAVGVRRHRAVERHPDADQRGAAASRHGHVGRPAADHRRRRRGVGDRDPHPGSGGAAGRHLVLDGDGEPLAADEADRAGAQPPGEHAVPVRCARRSSRSAATPER